MNIMRHLKAYLIAEAVEGGYFVHNPGGLRSDVFPVVNFAGSLPDCLEYIRKQYDTDAMKEAAK